MSVSFLRISESNSLQAKGKSYQISSTPKLTSSLIIHLIKLHTKDLKHLYCTFHYERKKVKTYYPIEI